MDTIRAVHYNLNVPYLCPQYASFTPSDPRCFGPLGKFQHNIEISIRTARVSRLSVSCDYARSYVCPNQIQRNLKRKEYNLQFCSLKHCATITVLYLHVSLLNDFQMSIIKNFYVQSVKSDFQNVFKL